MEGMPVKALVARAAFLIVQVMFAVAALMVIAILGAADGVARLWQWIELHAVYSGDAEAQDRARWKAS